MDEDTKKILERPFAKEFIKQRTQGGKQCDYVEIHVVEQRLNDALGQDGWDFELDQMIQTAEEVIQFGKIGIRNENGDMVWKGDVGCQQIIYKSGALHEPGNEVSLGNNMKMAVSDLLKRCAKHLGVALGLYGEVEEYEHPETSVITNIKMGEKELCAVLKCEEADLRSEFFKTDAPLENVSADERSDYLKHLRETRESVTKGVIAGIEKAEACLVSENILNGEAGISAMRKRAGLSDGTLDYDLVKLSEYQARAEAYYDKQMKAKGN